MRGMLTLINVGNCPPAGATKPAFISLGSFTSFGRKAHEATNGRTVVLDSTKDKCRISRRHCSISHESSGWVLQDHNSANGIFVNGCRCRRVVLQSGDTIVFGADHTIPFGGYLPRKSQFEFEYSFDLVHEPQEQQSAQVENLQQTPAMEDEALRHEPTQQPQPPSGEENPSAKRRATARAVQVESSAPTGKGADGAASESTMARTVQVKIHNLVCPASPHNVVTHRTSARFRHEPYTPPSQHCFLPTWSRT